MCKLEPSITICENLNHLLFLWSLHQSDICDDKIYHQNLNLKGDESMRRPTKLPSASKNGAKFRHTTDLKLIWFDYSMNFINNTWLSYSFILFPSGTEISLSTFETVDNLVAQIICYLQKVRYCISWHLYFYLFVLLRLFSGSKLLISSCSLIVSISKLLISSCSLIVPILFLCSCRCEF